MRVLSKSETKQVSGGTFGLLGWLFAKKWGGWGGAYNNCNPAPVACQPAPVACQPAPRRHGHRWC